MNNINTCGSSFFSNPFRLSAGQYQGADTEQDSQPLQDSHPIGQTSSLIPMKAGDDSMIGAGIFCGDTIIVDRSIEPESGKVVAAMVEGVMTVKRLCEEDGRIFLVPDNTEYQPVEITSEVNFEIIGVVTKVIHEV